MTDDEEYFCDEPRPEGFTYYGNMTVCNTCFTKFLCYECYCELKHDCRPKVGGGV
jgi:hypothetical protein